MKLYRLSEEFPDVQISDYIEFFQLRVYAHLHGEAKTDQIFVHSKMMIVDDRIAIIGSNNVSSSNQSFNQQFMLISL